DAEVEQSLLDIGRDLLRPEKPDPVDPGIVDDRVVVTLRRPAHGEGGSVEQLQRGPFERALRYDKRQQRGNPSIPTTGGTPTVPGKARGDTPRRPNNES